MRRTVAIALVALGAFALVLGVLLRVWAYPRLATVPLDQTSRTVSVGEDMSVLLIRGEGLKVLRGVKVTSVRLVDGDAKAARERGDDRSAFWETSVTNETGGEVLSQSTAGVSFDRVTGLATNCCGDYAETVAGDKAPVRYEGLYYKFPFDTRRDDYPFWDDDLGKATPAVFSGEETLEGVSVFKFVQRIPDTSLGQQDVPGSLWEASITGNVTADLMYANTRTLWVEPNTGVILKGQEEQNKRLVYNGAEVPATVGTIAYDAATVKETADAYGFKGTALGAIHGAGSTGLAALGGLAVLAGLTMLAGEATRGRGRRVLPADAPDSVDLRTTDGAPTDVR